MASPTKSVTYSSTRGGQQGIDFRTVVLQGLALDRGLFVPDELPKVTVEDLKEWRSLSYADLAVQVIRKFVKDDQVPLANLKDIVKRSCDAFRSPDVTPVVQVGGHAILELFHGPTFAFKDVALQMLGNFFEYFLETGSNDGRLTVLGATSGDTGSAAIAGVTRQTWRELHHLYPNHGRVSPIQERQMTTVAAVESNIHCVAVDGTFDDCQDLVKASFQTPEFRKDVHLGAVNSINWCRVLAQTTYYFWSWLRVTDNDDENSSEVHYSVPTGNFGDILAGYYAQQMGLPVGKLIVATNQNDILYRFFTKGEYHRESIHATISPSMDICVSSNFERYLFHLAGNSSEQLSKWMMEFEQTHQLTLSGDWLRKAQADFDSARADTDMTLATIQEYATKYNYVLCPHSAVGVSAIHQLELVSENTVCLATAHEAKFPAAVAQALGGADKLPTPPEQLARLAELPTSRTELPNDLETVQQFVRDCVSNNNNKHSKLCPWCGVFRMQGLSSCTDASWQRKVLLGAVAVGVAAVVVQVVARRR